MMAQKGCNDKLDAAIDWIGHVSRHLISLFGAIEFTDLHAFRMQI